ncbi:MAG TPA: hypothetical protein VHY20_14235, partial [Pirellulales bacterium]|nr:hypothetical protein [Pirellulales bacterium]
GDNTYYIGLLPLVMLGYALVRERSRVFLALAAGALSLCWLSMGGTFAKCVYHWPGMHMFRHVGLVFSIGALLILLAGGFGLDRFVRRCRGLSLPPAPQLTHRLVLLLVVGGLVLADLLHCWRPFDLELRFVHGDAWPFAAFRGLLYLVAGLAVLAGCWSRFRSRLAAALPALAAVVFLLDMGSFRAEVFATIERVPLAGQTAGVFAADRLPYRSERSAEAADELARARLEVFTRPLRFVHNGHNVSANSMMALDSCRPQFRGDFLCQGVCELLRRRGGIPSPHPTDAYLPADDLGLRKVLGCGVPKLRLTRQVKIARSDEQAAAWFAASPDPDATTILQTDDPGVSDSGAESPGQPCGTIHVEDFSSNALAAKVCVAGRAPAWLVYADAWHPGWTALVDGVRVAVPRATLGLKAVQVPSGTHRVEFVYAPALRNALAWTFALLGLSAGAGLLIQAAVSILAEIRSRPTPGSPGEAPSPSWARRPARKSALRV